MNLIRKYSSRKYLMRIWLTLAISANALLIVSGWTIYANSEKTVLRVQDEANAKVLSQVNYNIDYMNELVRNMTISLFFDPDGIYLLNSHEISKANLYPKIARLEKLANTSSFLDSILIYNKNTDCYYSSRYTLSCKDDGLNGVIDHYLQAHKENIPKLGFIPISSTAKGTADMFSYMMYETLPGEKEVSKLILNVRPEWLFENINLINTLDKQAENGTFILDQQGHSFQTGGTLPFDISEIAPAIVEHHAQSGSEMNTFIRSHGAKKWIVSYKNTGTNDWMIVSVQDYKKVFSETYRMRYVTIYILFGFIVISILASVGIAFMLYRPLNRTLAQMDHNGEAGEQTEVKDEFSFISNRYNQALEGVEQLKKEQEEKLGSLKTFLLRRLLADSAAVTAQELSNASEQGRLEVDFNSTMAIVLLQLDGYDRMEDRMIPNEKRLYKFALGNIAGEIIARSFKNEVVDMRSDHQVLLVNIGEWNETVENQLVKLLKEVQRVATSYYRISVTATVSDSIHQQGEVSKQYARALERAKYRFVHGKQSILMPSMDNSNLQNPVFEFPPDTAKKLEESIKSGDKKLFEDQLISLTDYVGRLSYDNIVYMLLHLISIVNHSLKEISQNSLVPIHIDLKSYYHLIIEKETWKEAQQTLQDLFNDIMEQRKENSAGQANSILVDTMKDIIDDRYSDPNLSLQSIASILKMSTAHISKMFRDREQVPINEYITDVRLNHARLLLESSDYTVNEIMERIGFSNQSYFFRLFKKKYGTTPKEYRTKKSVI